MATPTYEAIASTTLASSASSVTFSSLDTIAAGYRDLIVVISGTMASASGIRAELNSDTTDANYSGVTMRGTGSSASSLSYLNPTVGSLSSATVSQTIFQLFDFSATDKHKSFLCRDDRSDAVTSARAVRWANTAAVTTMTLVADSTTFNSGTTFSLYGISA